MKEILLTQGKVALVDDDMYNLLSRYKWYAAVRSNTIYVQKAIPRRGHNEKRRVMLLHHVIMGHPITGLEVDHIDGNGLNNQRKNLHFVTTAENGRNRVEHRSGQLLGVSFNKRSNRWIAQRSINGKHFHLGSFHTQQVAHKTYLEYDALFNPKKTSY